MCSPKSTWVTLNNCKSLLQDCGLVVWLVDCKWQQITTFISMFVLGEPDLNQCWETWVQHFPAVFSVGGWDWNRDSIPLLSKEEMRVFFGWMLCPGLISHEEMQLTISPFLSHAPTNTHTVSDMLTFPHRHLSLSLCGCKVFSLPPTLPSNNERACAYTRARALYHTF